METSKEPERTTLKEGATTEIILPSIRSRVSAREQLPPSGKQAFDQNAQVATQTASTASARKTGGPRTQHGKRKSKHNALKHGIFSRAVLLQGEPRGELDSLLSGLRNDLEPEGIIEQLLVDKLATLLWRHRRLIIAEGAEIQKRTDFLEWDQMRLQDDEAANMSVFGDESANLMRRIGNPRVLERCLHLLETLKGCIEKDGFDEENDKDVLIELYGEYDSDNGSETLLDTYSKCLSAADSDTSDGEHSGLPIPEECKNNFLEELKEEITRLKRYKRQLAFIEARKLKVESLCAIVPDAPHLLRYGTTLERDFDRTLNQLERQQRMRKGHPAPPTLNVNLLT